ncbi:MAG: DUF3800 domain-containing protein [Chlorobiales bacterium]|nr:DUF3800 domain-containing protein [Chlorobiales bacterium]
MKTSFKIYCDETWIEDPPKGKSNHFVFYGVMIEEKYEREIREKLDEFKKERGLFKDGSGFVEIKWKKIENEYKSLNKLGRRNRYEEFLEIFFSFLNKKQITFACLHLEKAEYDRIKHPFNEKQPDSKHNFFFMMYYQFLYHCFIKNQFKQNKCEVLIDNRNVGGPNSEYDLNKLCGILNKKLHIDITPKGQLTFFQRELFRSVSRVELVDSKQEVFIQMSDLCGGCVKYILDNKLRPPTQNFGLWDDLEQEHEAKDGRESLAKFFYQKPTEIERYEKVDLSKASRSHHFNIFPFKF